jgi:hypothetical protein
VIYQKQDSRNDGFWMQIGILFAQNASPQIP